MRRFLSLLLVVSGAVGCDDTPVEPVVDASVDAAALDLGPDGAVADAGVPDVGPDAHVFSRPGPRAVTPQVLGQRLGAVSDLARDGDEILALTRTGWLYALDGQGGQRVLRQDLPESGRLLATSAGVLVVHAEGITPVTTGPSVEVLGAHRVVATEDALVWVDAGEDGRVVRYGLPDGPLQTVAAGLGAVSAVWPHPDGTITVGVGGEEPRQILTLAADGTVTATVESRFVPEFFAALNGDLYAHMMTGAGWLERVTPDRLWRLAYVGRGFGDLQAFDGALWWHTNAAIVRAVPGEPPEAVRMGINPAALLVEADQVIWASPWREQVLALPR